MFLGQESHDPEKSCEKPQGTESTAHTTVVEKGREGNLALSPDKAEVQDGLVGERGGAEPLKEGKNN